MKKIAFALQVFTLMMLLPVCVVIEMNHEIVAPTEKDIVASAGGNLKMIPVDQPRMESNKMKS
jgi:hypothetical protein